MNRWQIFRNWNQSALRGVEIKIKLDFGFWSWRFYPYFDDINLHFGPLHIWVNRIYEESRPWKHGKKF